MPPLPSDFRYSLTTNPNLREDDIEVDADPRMYINYVLKKYFNEFIYICNMYSYFNVLLSISYLLGRFISEFSEVPSDKELQRICSGIAHNNHYARLGRELGVKDSEIQRIKEEQKGDLLEAAFQTLKKWREMNGNSATKFALLQALKSIGLSDVCALLKDDP
jgi:hypothetical protein